MRYLIAVNDIPAREVNCHSEHIEMQLVDGETATEIAEDFVIDWQISEPPQPPLDQLKSKAKRDIDNAADRARKRYITDIAAQSTIYSIKYQQALDYQADNTQIGAYLQSESTRTNSDVSSVAQLFINKHRAWESLGVATEAIRLAAKDEIDALLDTGTEVEVQTIVDAALVQLSQI